MLQLSNICESLITNMAQNQPLNLHSSVLGSHQEGPQTHTPKPKKGRPDVTMRGPQQYEYSSVSCCFKVESPGQQLQGDPQRAPAAAAPGLQCVTAECVTWLPTADSPPLRFAAWPAIVIHVQSRTPVRWGLTTHIKLW